MPEEPTLHIPPDYVPALRALSALTDDAAERMRSALGARSNYDRATIVNDVATAAASWNYKTASSLVEALLAIQSIRNVLKLSESAVSLAAARAPELELEKDQADALARRIEAVLVAPSITLTARAQNLASEHERNLEEVRIITDIRPLFSQESEDELDGALISHSLRIRHSSIDGSSALYISLNMSDMASLRSAIDRAVQKAGALQHLLMVSAVPHIKPESPAVDEPNGAVP